MSASTLAMSNSFPSPTRKSGFLRRLIMLLLFTAAMVAWMSLLQRYQKNLSHTWMTVFADLGIALAAGLGARLAFYQRNYFIRFITATGALILGLFGLGFFTNWQTGIGPLEFWRNDFDWFEIAQMAGGLVIVLISLQAWWRPDLPVFETSASPAAPSRRERRARAHAPKLPQFSLPRFRGFAGRAFRSRKSGQLKVARSARSRSRRSSPEIEKVVVPRPVKSARSSRKRLFERKPELQLSVYEEHRCPYCLEEVRRNDSRGVKECDICHTLHHADCWNVTGMCQIPHLNSLNM